MKSILISLLSSSSTQTISTTANTVVNASVAAAASSTSVSTRCPRQSHLGYITASRYKATKNPIVLCHGLFGFDVIGPQSIPRLQLHYWRGISDALKDLGCHVGIARVGAVSSIPTRASQLSQYLDSLPSRKVNLIGHSMGGLDGRYMIAHSAPRHTEVVSLTTIATPHRGSAFMDWCRDRLGLGHAYYECPVKKVAGHELPTVNMTSCRTHRTKTHQRIANQSEDQKSLLKSVFSVIDTPAFSNLTREYCSAFNKVTPDDPHVYYQSYAAVTQVPAFAPLFFPYTIVREKEGPNDGLVSLTSAKWGHFRGTVDGDHWDLVPSKMRRGTLNSKKAFDAIDLYMEIVTDLANRGY